MEVQFAFKKKPPRCGGGCAEVTLPSVAPAAWSDDDGDGAFYDGVLQMPGLPTCKARYRPTRMRGTSSSLFSPFCDVASWASKMTSFVITPLALDFYSENQIIMP
jgi:hypothetical protein